MYDGRTAPEEGTVVGHEIMGVVEGEAVKRIKEGDRVVLPFNVSCGFCFNCHRRHTEGVGFSGQVVFRRWCAVGRHRETDLT